VIDGLLGIGLSRDVEAPFAALIGRINEARAPVLAIDLPSGLDSATGAIRGKAVRATRTLTFIAHKAGLHTHDGPDCCGEVALADLGLGALTQSSGQGSLLAPASVRGWLPTRPRNAHKGRFGTLGVVGGARGMVGAALLAGRAAVLCGAGKTRVAVLDDRVAIDPLQPEMMIASLDEALAGDVVVIGPGGGPSIESVARALALDVPVVVDADALNAVSRDGALGEACRRRRAPTLMTPHPGEAARLLGCDNAAIQHDRRAAALRLAAGFNAFVVLKGAGSVCAAPTGEWAINTTGNAGLASGGTGDVLAGMLGALLAQRLDPWRALQFGVCLHGAAADALVARGVGPVGLTASEVAVEARRVLNSWTQGGPI
jgi:ADP-dependent NAD(P)H-hydrate dehydratase / NAD(P)H-hydrate epimerase